MSKIIYLLLLSVISLSAEVMKVRADTWMPYNGDPKAKDNGYIIELLKEIFEPEVKIDYNLLPWKRALKDCEEGSIDAVVGAYTVDVPGFVLPKECVDVSSDAFFKLKTHTWMYKDIKSLGSEKMGYIINYATNEELIKYMDANQKSDKVQLVGGEDPLEQNLKKLLAGRITVVLDNYSVLKYRIHEMKADDKIVFAGKFLDEVDKIYVAFSPKRPTSKKYAEIFDRKFNELKASGRVNEIRKKYNLDPLK